MTRAVVKPSRERGDPGGFYVSDDGLHVEWPHPPDSEPEWWPETGWRWPTPTVHERIRRVAGRPRWIRTHTLTRHLIGGMLGVLYVEADAAVELTTADGQPLLTIGPGVWEIYLSDFKEAA